MITPETEPPFHSPLLIKRLKAIVIDAVLVLALMFVAAGLFNRFYDAPGWLRGFVVLFLLGVYEPLFTSLGATLGHKLMKIRVRRAEDPGKSINIFRSYGRFIIKLLLGMLSFITIHFNKERRAIHDFAGHSVMIEVDEAHGMVR